MTAALLVFASMTPIANAQSLTLGPLVPGKAGHDNTILLTGGTPGESVRLAISGTPGSTEIGGCPGVFVDMANPAVTGPVTVDTNGEAVLAGHVPAGLEGQTRIIQAVQRATCDISSAQQWLFPSGTQLDLSSAPRFLGQASDGVGSVSSAGDANGDGVDDILVGAGLNEDFAVDGGVVYLIFGGVGYGAGHVDLANADAKLFGVSGDFVGIGSSAGDVNSDGFDDVLIGAPSNDRGGTDAGAVYVVLGPVSGPTPERACSRWRWV